MMPLNVVVVDDSVLCRERLRAIIEAEGDLRVVADASSGEEALALVQRHAPAVLVTDLIMPRIGGLEVVEQVMADNPVPVIVVTGKQPAESTAAFEATRRGALEFAEKPALGDRDAEAALRQALRRVAQVTVVRHPRVIRRQQVVGPGPVPRWNGACPVVVGIGASAGGPAALATLLGALPHDFRSCVAVAQHLPRGHDIGFASFLRSRCSLEPIICREPTPIRPGTLLLAADGFDLAALDEHRLGPVPPRLELGLLPSVDALLSSLAEHLGDSAAGVVLSGIGYDGAAGLAALREKGALTVVQDSSSCAVYGMPKAAAQHACWELSPQQIASLLIQSAAGSTIRGR